MELLASDVFAEGTVPLVALDRRQCAHIAFLDPASREALIKTIPETLCVVFPDVGDVLTKRKWVELLVQLLSTGNTPSTDYLHKLARHALSPVKEAVRATLDTLRENTGDRTNDAKDIDANSQGSVCISEIRTFTS